MRKVNINTPCVVVIVLAVVHCGNLLKLRGENVCTQQVLESKLVNVSYLDSVRIKKHSLCLTPPFLCSDWVNTMATRWREDNITRTVTRHLCCPGYKETEDSRCQPHCPEGCVHGECDSPGMCRCDVGHSGLRCESVGCPSGHWGEDCKEECRCQHGSWCHPVTGDCHCSPGYQGSSCQLPCGPGLWGEACSNSCDCLPGLACHHVTGDCSPCPQGTYGQLCASHCQCGSEGTQICSHLDGQCYCKGNWFGQHCELHCPFGFMNKTCLTSPQDGSCQCPNDLYTCDTGRGCVCPPGQDCGIELLDSSIKLSPYSDPGTDNINNHTAAITFSVLIIAGVAVILVIIYYRRRMGVMKKDLQNRSVYYCEREQFNQHDRSYDLIIRDQDPLNNITETNNVSNNVANNCQDLLNNVTINLESQRLPNTIETNCMKKVNNVSNENTDGATATPGAAYDVNIYSTDQKSNLNQRFYPKVMKADLEVMIRNNLADKNDNDDDSDSLHKLKVNLSKNKSSE